MSRLRSALREWLELRGRVREERQFHLERAAADYRALGVTAREAKRMARTRFGSRRNSQAGLRELGGDLQGLAQLIRAHRVVTSLWLQPALSIGAIAVMLAVSPSRLEMLEGVLGHIFGPEGPEEVALAIQGAGPASPGITEAELEGIQSMTTLSHAESVGPHQVLAQPVHGITLAAITSEARVRTGNSGFYVTRLLPQPRVMTSPAKVVWLFIALYGAFFFCARIGKRVTLRWLLYAVFAGCLHALVSIFGWALATQLWNRASWHSSTAAGLTFSLLAVTYLLVVAAQCRYWWRDLRYRCPICLDRLLLSWTLGDDRRILVNAPITESVCAQGHGVLIESRWSRDFRSEHSPLTGLARI